MKELKSVKFNVGMYDDIKLKIIDTMKERDLIHYCLARFIVLAGKINMNGYLFINENMPYTIEALAIEFNRSIEEIELSIKALIDLEILELTEEKIYKVKNWVKHQNIRKKSSEYSCEKDNNEKININEKETIKEDDNSSKTVLEYGDEILTSRSIDENKSLSKRNKEMSEYILEEEKNELIINMNNGYKKISAEDKSEIVDDGKNLVEINLLKDNDNEDKENNTDLKDNSINDNIIFEFKEEINSSFEADNEKKQISSEQIINSDLKGKPNKGELKKKQGRRGRPKKSSSSNSKTRNLKKDNSLIQFSCDEYEDDDFNVKDNEFVTFTMG